MALPKFPKRWECQLKAGLPGPAEDIFGLHHLHPTSLSEEPLYLCHLCCNTTKPPPAHESHPTPRTAASPAGLWTLFLCRYNLGLEWEVLRGAMSSIWATVHKQWGRNASSPLLRLQKGLSPPLCPTCLLFTLESQNLAFWEICIKKSVSFLKAEANTSLLDDK